MEKGLGHQRNFNQPRRYLFAKAGEFNSLLLQAVDSALVDSLGDYTTKAVKLRVEVSVLTKDPDQFRAQLEKLFAGSELGTKFLEGKIT
jgi:hypothetical protein